MRVLVPRAADQDPTLGPALAAAGHDVLHLPLTAQLPRPDAVAAGWRRAGGGPVVLLLTSPVAAALAVPAQPAGTAVVEVVAVGARTAAAARSPHLPAPRVAAGGGADAVLVVAQALDALATSGAPPVVLWPRGARPARGTRPALRSALAARAPRPRLVDPVVYATAPIHPAPPVREAQADVIVVTAPSVARALAAAWGPSPWPPTIALGPTTAAALSRLGHPPQAVAGAPRADAVVAAIAGLP